MKRYILVDTENIGTYNSLKDLMTNEPDEYNIILFKSNNSKPIKAEFWEILLNKSSSVKMVEVVGSGNENMDIQIASYAGYLVAQSNDTHNTIYIYSNDNHFKNCSFFLNSLSSNLKILFLKEDILSSKEKINLTKELEIEIRKLTPKVDKVIKIINNNKAKNKLHNELRDCLSNGREIYLLVRKYVSY